MTCFGPLIPSQLEVGLIAKQEMFKSLFREFADKGIMPIAVEIDESREFPHKTVNKIGALGFLGLPFPQEY